MQKSGGLPRISSPRPTSQRGVVGRLGVLDDPVGRAAVAEDLEVGLHPGEGAALGPDLVDRGDLGAEREDRLDLQRRAEQRLGGTDPAAAPQVLERVEAEPHLQGLAGLPGLGDDLRRRRRRAGRNCAADRTMQPSPPAPVWASTTSTAPGWPRAASERAASRALSQVPEMPEAMWIETTSRPAASSGS